MRTSRDFRLLFLAGTAADLGTISAQLTVFTVSMRSAQGADLVMSPFAAERAAIASPADYTATQALGTAMRDARVELFRYPSARDPQDGVNVGAFSPTVFGRAKPRELQTWQCTASSARVEFAKRDYFGKEEYAFDRAAFLVDGLLPSPAS